MQKLMLIFVGLFAFGSAAVGETKNIVVIDGIATEANLELTVPETTDCQTSGSTLRIVTCKTPDATLDLGAGRVVSIETLSTITSVYNDVTLADATYTGSFAVGDVAVRVVLNLINRNDAIKPGTLTIGNEQKFTVIPQ